MTTDFVLGFLARSTVILCVAWLSASLLSRASADLRHKIWLAALIGAAIAFLPISVPEPLRIEVESRGAATAAAAAGVHRGLHFWMTFWALGSVLPLARLGLGLATLRKWTQQASDFEGSLFSDSAATAVTWGIRRPIILLPGYMRSWPAERREMVLVHERAHIARHDWVWQTFAQAVTAIFWFQPLMWIAATRLRNEAERAADDLVLQTGVSCAAYATSLIEAARRLQGDVPRVALAMAAEGALSSRVRAILDTNQARRPANRRSRLAILAVSAGLFVVLASCQSVRVYKVGELTTPPRVVSKVEPHYTDDARDRKIMGTVGLNLVIDPQGRAENIRVAQSLDKGLDANAITAVRQWQFDPGKKDGKAVRTAAVIEVNYRLR